MTATSNETIFRDAPSNLVFVYTSMGMAVLMSPIPSARRWCPEDQAALYLAEVVENGNQIWRCGQVHCDYSEEVNPLERFRVTVQPINAENCSEGDMTHAQCKT